MHKRSWYGIFFMALIAVLFWGGAGNAFAGITDGLVGYYSFNDCTAADSSGTGNNGTIVGNSQCAQNASGSGLKFNGYSDRGYVTIPSSPSLMFLDNYTFTVWFNIQSNTSMNDYGSVSEYGMQSIFAKAGDRNGLIVRTVRDQTDGLLRLLTYNGRLTLGEGFGTTTTKGFGLNEWHMASVTSGNGEVKVYFDCELQNSTPTDLFKVNTSMQYMPLQLGVDQDAWWYPINGMLDEARVYGRALSEDEVKALYRAGGLGNKTPQEAIVRFDAAAKDIKVYNRMTGAEAGYVVLPAKHETEARDDDDNEGEYNDQDNEHHKELRQYAVQDCAGDMVLTLSYRQEGHEARVRIVSMQYDGGPVIEPAKNKVQAEYAVDKDGSIKHLEQKIAVKKRFEVEAKYSGRTNETRIDTEAKGQQEKKETRPGMTILELVTDKGGLTYRY